MTEWWTCVCDDSFIVIVIHFSFTYLQTWTNKIRLHNRQCLTAQSGYVVQWDLRDRQARPTRWTQSDGVISGCFPAHSTGILNNVSLCLYHTEVAIWDKIQIFSEAMLLSAFFTLLQSAFRKKKREFEQKLYISTLKCTDSQLKDSPFKSLT